MKNNGKGGTHKALTLKQKKFALEYVKNGGNGTKAAFASYDTTYDNAEVIGAENIRKPLVIDEVNRILAKKGLNSDEYVADKMLQSLDLAIGKDPKHSDAVRMIDMLLKLRNAYPASKHFNVNVSGNLSGIKDIGELKISLESLNTKTNKLIEDLKST